MSPILAASLQANLYFALFIVIGAVGLIFGYFTVRGSGINNHPYDHREAPGARLPDEFHQFAGRQALHADRRKAAREAWADVPPTPVATSEEVHHADDLTIDEMNRRLAAEAAARKQAESTAESAQHFPLR